MIHVKASVDPGYGLKNVANSFSIVLMLLIAWFSNLSYGIDLGKVVATSDHIAKNILMDIGTHSDTK